VFCYQGLLWKKLNVLPLPKGDEIHVSEIIKISWPLWITNLTLFVLVQSALWVMGLFRSPEEVAVYGAAVRAITLVTMPLLIVNLVVPPLGGIHFAPRNFMITAREDQHPFAL
jgi:O-antigen/teichoic acid export membrane protein